jgi:hypothetical protein
MRKMTLCTAMVTLICGFAFGQVQEKVLYSFCSVTNCADGASPHGALVFDSTGNLYGTTEGGGTNCQGVGGCGTVFELTPSGDGTWTETVLYSFCVNSVRNCPDGVTPMAGPTFDHSGNLYGTTHGGGPMGWVVFSS